MDYSILGVYIGVPLFWETTTWSFENKVISSLAGVVADSNYGCHTHSHHYNH